jgi:hypothetical protein
MFCNHRVLLKKKKTMEQVKGFLCISALNPDPLLAGVVNESV